MIAKRINVEDLRLGDEVIVAFYDGRHVHCIIETMTDVYHASETQSSRHFTKKSGDGKKYLVDNTDWIYLINRAAQYSNIYY